MLVIMQAAVTTKSQQLNTIDDTAHSHRVSSGSGLLPFMQCFQESSSPHLMAKVHWLLSLLSCDVTVITFVPASLMRTDPPKGKTGWEHCPGLAASSQHNLYNGKRAQVLVDS